MTHPYDLIRTANILRGRQFDMKDRAELETARELITEILGSQEPLKPQRPAVADEHVRKDQTRLAWWETHPCDKCTDASCADCFAGIDRSIGQALRDAAVALIRGQEPPKVMALEQALVKLIGLVAEPGMGATQGVVYSRADWREKVLAIAKELQE